MISERICEQVVDVPVPQVDMQEITNAIEALHFQSRAISDELQGKYSDVFSGKEGSVLSKKHVFKMQLYECSKKIDALREQNSGILGRVGDRVAEGPLEEGKKLMAEATVLERNKPQVSEYNKKEDEMKVSDPCLSLWSVTKINEQMVVLEEEQKGLPMNW